MVAGGGGVLSCPLVPVLPVVAGSPSAWKPGSLEAWKGHFLPSLGVILIRESSNTPNRPETGQNRPETGQRSAKLPIYIGVFRAFSGSAKNQSFVSDNMPYKAFRGRITPKFDNSL